VRLKKELDMVLNLQGDLDTVEKVILSAQTTLLQTQSSQESVQVLKTLKQTHQHLKEQVDVLYTSLNVQSNFPDLQGMDLEFIRTLIMVWDLKINIRKQAISSFFKWEKLDQAVGGCEEALGMICNTLFNGMLDTFI
jgi:CMP-2-keto-3-deoxyoctulosonic acid synthetase